MQSSFIIVWQINSKISEQFFGRKARNPYWVLEKLWGLGIVEKRFS